MPCGKIQIEKVINGIDFGDNMLNIKPEISLFKTVYKRYVNFSNDYIRVSFNSENNLSLTDNSVFTAKIDNIGHTLNDIYLVIDIPNIYNLDNISFINDFGVNIIDYVSFSIGGNIIHEFDNDWINIYYKKMLPYEKYLSIKNLINPQKSGNYLYSYNAQSVYVWLPFNFSKSISNGIPLLAIKYDDLFINIRIKPMKNWLIVNNKPIVEISKYINGNFDLSMNMSVYFFEKTILNKIINSSKEFFIEQTFMINYVDITSKTINIPILNKQMIKEFFIIAQRSDNVDRNVFGNYTNYENNLTFSGNYNENIDYVFSDYYNKSYIIDIYKQYNNEFSPEIINSIQLYLNGQPRFTTIDSRFLKLVHTYIYGLNYQNIYDYIYYYSFSNNPNEFLPNGALTLDRINSMNLLIYLNNIPPINKLQINTLMENLNRQLKGKSIEIVSLASDKDSDYVFSYNIKVYLTTYNIIKFSKGTVNLVWPI